MNLDLPERFGTVDTADALADVEAAWCQWDEARALSVPDAPAAGATAVLVTGMGGSGTVGDVVAALAAERLSVPVVVHKDYGAPAFAGPGTLAVVVSHSGDTEETCSALTEAHGRGSRVLAVTTGGRVGEYCDEHGLPWVRIPAGGPPRHSLGWLAGPALAALGLDGGADEAVALVRDLAEEWGRHMPVAANPAKQVALRLAGVGLPVVYGAEGLAAVAARRLENQLNENAKLQACSEAMPELCHNDIVGWQSPAPVPAGLLCLRDPAGEHPRVARRFAVLDELVGDRFRWREQVLARGEAPLARLLSLLSFADHVSVYAALARDVDPTPIHLIDALKRRLDL
ncbi:MAG: bifunctional phosphoglucose/phosphomannose isomerase [Actinomycetota bacterium]|nr:bifunctional phosphoglucose/phosphomannose isomerase [Actinomycetota bacterium]